MDKNLHDLIHKIAIDMRNLQKDIDTLLDLAQQLRLKRGDIE